jgi:hypothetical protein
MMHGQPNKKWLPVEDETPSTDTWRHILRHTAVSTSNHPTHTHIWSLTLPSHIHISLCTHFTYFLDGQLKRHQCSVTWQCRSGMEVTTCSTYEGASRIMISRDKPNKRERKNLPTCHPAHHKSQMNSTATESEAPLISIDEVYSRLCHLPALSSAGNWTRWRMEYCEIHNTQFTTAFFTPQCHTVARYPTCDLPCADLHESHKCVAAL